MQATVSDGRLVGRKEQISVGEKDTRRDGQKVGWKAARWAGRIVGRRI